ncbi:hypothetical protein [Tropicimonas isoalkanivorans]|uniref:D-alanine-D-alanine ligase n=1 Tax=Tropicimonas isoalkanivorans TaxID=441112 RepID=A0A1I1IJH1_9RHOB|nr:hypothetical protein [Tropicimonas isoalkanivorans]SFC36396.1 D-alanine-D-alanine ligase [Tropicimonas isoalkanivorans]
MRLTPPDARPRPGVSPYRSLLAQAAAARGGTVELEEAYGFVGRYTTPTGRTRPIVGKALGLNCDSAVALAADKDYTARWLAADGLPTPPGLAIFSPAYCTRRALKNAAVAGRLPETSAGLAFARTQGLPVIVKPNRGAEGRGVTLARTEAELAEDIAAGFATEEQLRIEAQVPGRDYRLLVLDGTVLLAYERLPFAITGDGERTIAELLSDALATLATTRRGPRVVADDPRITRCLASRRLTPASVPAKGASLPLLETANLSTGGRARDLTGTLPPEAEALATAATRSLGLTLAGVDILAPNLPAGTEGATILEVNAAPSLDHFAAESAAHRQRALAALTDMLARLE